MATWILQANPKKYDVNAALAEMSVIYWRVPQYTSQLAPGDVVLVWVSGKDAGIVGVGRVLASAGPYDLAGLHDPYWTADDEWAPGDPYVPVGVRAVSKVPKSAVAEALPEHRIVTAPMGTVFPVDAEDISRLAPIFNVLSAAAEVTSPPSFTALPLLKDAPAPLVDVSTPAGAARITPALVLLSSSPARPIEITVEGDSLRMLLAERTALKALGTEWDAVGVYLLIGSASTPGAVLSLYVGKAQALRNRLDGHGEKPWSRCLLIQRPGLQPFNASDIGWLERRLYDVLIETPIIDLTNKQPPTQELVPDYKAEILERTVMAALSVIGMLGAYVQ